MDRRSFLAGSAASLIAAPAGASARPLVLLFRGADQVLFRGMDQLAVKIGRIGYATDVWAPSLSMFLGWLNPVCLIGHSSGADAALAMAHVFKRTCQLLITIEPTVLGPPVPAGMRCVNIHDPARFPAFVRVTGANNIPVSGHAHEALGRSPVVHEIILNELRGLIPAGQSGPATPPSGVSTGVRPFAPSKRGARTGPRPMPGGRGPL